MTPPSSPAYGVYIHWPFCAAKCPYCDFNSHVRNTVDENAYVNALIQELKFIQSRTGAQPVKSIFFGGGTPSLMGGESIGLLIEAIDANFNLSQTAEITLEANPSSAEARKFKDYKAAGVNRISIGVQSLNQKDLKALGRIHTVQEAKNAVKMAQKIFERVSFDIIYARPHQTIEAWHQELTEALQMASGHMSLYQLTIEPETTFEALFKKGKLIMPDTDLARAFYEETHEILEKNGYTHYEISNYAHTGQQSIHNLVYWRYEPYIGIGPGAHGRIIPQNTSNMSSPALIATATHKHPETWLKSVHENGHGLTVDEPLTMQDISDEILIMGLRLKEGISLRKFETRTKTMLNQKDINDLVDLNMLHVPESGHIAATLNGFLVLDTLITKLTSGAKPMHV